MIDADSRIEFGLRAAEQQTPLELVGEVEISWEADPATRCVTCQRLGAGTQKVVLVSLHNDLGEEHKANSIVFNRAKKALMNCETLKGPFCEDHNDLSTDLVMEEVLVG